MGNTTQYVDSGTTCMATNSRSVWKVDRETLNQKTLVAQKPRKGLFTFASTYRQANVGVNLALLLK